MRFLRLVGRRDEEPESGGAGVQPPAARPASERLTVAAAARRLGVSESTVRRRVGAGALRHLRERAGGRSRIWVILDSSPVASPPEVVEAVAAEKGARWAVRHRHTFAWLAGESLDSSRLAPALSAAHLFASEAAAEEAARAADAPLEVVAVYRPQAASA
jgi:excisionase family DNA binding protein